MGKSTKWSLLPATLMVSAMLLSACGGNATDTPGTTGAGSAAGTAATGAGNNAGTAVTGAGDAAATAAAAAGNNAGTAVTGAGNNAATAVTGAGNAAGTAVTTGAMIFDPTTYKKNAVEDGATLRVSSWGDPSEQQVNRDALARFNKVYPNVKVNYEPQPTDYQTKLKAQVKGGSEPDVFYIDPGLAYELIPANILLDLTPALAETGRSQSDYFDALMGPFTSGGKVYGVPKDFGSLAVFYNTDMQAKSGAPMPKDGWTQADFRNFVKASVQGSGQTEIFGTSVDPDFERWGAFVLANGGKIIDNNKCVINSQIGVDTLTWWYQMYKDKIATVPADIGAGWSGEGFAKLRLASTVQGGWLIPFMADPKGGFSGVKYDVAPLPAGTTGGKGDLLFFNAWGASAKSKFPKAAAALALFLASRENEDTILQTGFALPALKGLDNDPFFQGTAVANKASKILYATGAYGTPDYYGGVNDPKIKKAINDATQRVYAGQQAPKAALDQACQAVDPLLAGP